MPLLKNFQTQIKKLADSKEHIHIQPQVLNQAIDIGLESLAKRKNGETKIAIVPAVKCNADDKHDQTVIVMVTDDRPFLIDSITSECVTRHFTIEGILHNTLLVERQSNGSLKSLKVKTKSDSNDLPRESFLILTLQGNLGQSQTKQLHKSLMDIVEDVKFATSDWQKMRQAVLNTIEDLGEVKKAKDIALFDEYKAFLSYLYDNNFTLLGYREYKLYSKGKKVVSEVVKNVGLGLLSDAKMPVYINESRQDLSEELQQKRIEQATITVSKVNKRSTVHRSVPMDAVAIKTYDDKGNVIGEKVFIGLFTSVTYSRSIQDVPYLRHKVNQVMEQTKFTPNSHNYRALMHILEKYPRDELFQMDVDMLEKYALSIMALQEQPRVALYVREDVFKRYVSCLVYIPRDKYETDLRLSIQKILESEFAGECETFNTVLDDSPMARVIYRIKSDEKNVNKKYNHKVIETKLIETSRSWAERLREKLLAQMPSEKMAIELSDKYKDAFPSAYQDKGTAYDVSGDVLKIEQVLSNNSFTLNLYSRDVKNKACLNIKIYNPDAPVILSDILPILENFGFDVLAESPFEIHVGDKKVWIHDFDIHYKNADHAKPVEEIKDVFEAGLAAIWNKEAENDTLNSLISMAKMPWRDVLVLRAMVKYMRQTKIQYTPAYMMQAVTDYPDIADLMLEYFYGRFKPEHDEKTRQNLMDTNSKKILKKLDDVTSFDQDKILRTMLAILQATLRTNFFQNKLHVSFKLDSQSIDILPLPRPMVEIFVYSPRVEGVHLRAGKVARGGLRWSDRHEDFRTEVLGLIKAQNVKNAVIVPLGSKGGFVVKNPPKTGGRDAYLKEGIECYKIFVSGLLDVTDNISGAKIIPPKDVVRHDEDDPYLVVAADKGTATFSDIANGLSADYGFWLGDAFASGGSAGYDHKVMGITARGGWESVKRHFRELGRDIMTQDFSVIGVGDMGGDVFGNGMLLSPHIRLIGAFNHVHIFCDPNPDIKKSMVERQRLFKEVKGWDHYNQELLSKGGRIFNRSDKSLKLTPEIQNAFAIDKKEVSPSELMNAMLKTQADLLWFGGIGTYIKAPNETHADVGDKANDGIRVDAHEVKALVIGEGANLGVTQSARIAMSLLGIKCYADFIDNSGGVNSSDLEVNIKILFQQIMQETKLSIPERNKVLAKMTDDVAQLVLRNNYQQTQAISMAAHNAYDKITTHAALIEHLEKTAGLNRKIEFLPSVEAIEQRSKDGKGLTAPELAILISYSKIKLFQDLVDSNLPDDPSFQNWMTDYFPKLMTQKYEKFMGKHRLRREIISTQLANSIVNRMGPSYVMNQIAKTGLPACTIARVYFIVREVFDIRDLYEQIEKLDNIASAQVQIDAMDTIASFIDYTSSWFLKQYRDENLKDNNLVKLGQKYKASIAKIVKSLPTIIPESTRQLIAQREENFISLGLPKDIAARIALLPILNTSCDIVKIAEQENQDIATVAKVYFGLSESFAFVWLRDQARQMTPKSRWESDTLRGLIERFYTIQTELTKRIIREMCSSKKCPTQPVNEWIANNSGAVQYVLESIERLKSTDPIDFAMLTATEMRLQQLV